MHLALSNAMLEPYRLPLQDLLATTLPTQANTGGAAGDGERVREEISPEAGAWLEHHYTHVSDGLSQIAVRATLHAIIVTAREGFAFTAIFRARQHLQSLMNATLLLEQAQAVHDLAQLRRRIELDAMALAWMALQLLYTGRVRRDRRERR